MRASPMSSARLDDIVHPGYLHPRLPLSMQLLSDPEVPLPMMGMVHIHNRVDMHSQARLGEVVTSTSNSPALRAHEGTTIGCGSKRRSTDVP